MKNIMQECIGRQGEALAQVLGSAEELTAPFLERFAGAPLQRVVLAGAGSSYHALNMARPFAQRALGIPVLAGTPAQLGWLTPALAEDTLVIAASQSGTSSNTLALMERLRAQGFTVAAITQNPASVIAREADCHVPLAIPEERTGPKTMGVMGTMLTLQMMLAGLAERRGAGTGIVEGLRGDMRAIVEHLPGNIDLAVRWCRENEQGMAESAAYLVVGQGENGAVAGEAALKLVETVRVPTTPYELEEIIHGPLLAFGPRTTLLYLGAPWEEGTRPDALCGLCAEKGGRVYRVAMVEGAAGSAEGTVLTLRTAGRPLLAAYELLIPAQVISAYIPPAMGTDLDARARSPQEAVMAGHL